MPDVTATKAAKGGRTAASERLYFHSREFVITLVVLIVGICWVMHNQGYHAPSPFQVFYSVAQPVIIIWNALLWRCVLLCGNLLPYLEWIILLGPLLFIFFMRQSAQQTIQQPTQQPVQQLVQQPLQPSRQQQAQEPAEQAQQPAEQAPQQQAQQPVAITAESTNDAPDSESTVRQFLETLKAAGAYESKTVEEMQDAICNGTALTHDRLEEHLRYFGNSMSMVPEPRAKELWWELEL